MSVVFTVAQQKGGAGKTSLVAHLAAYLAADRRVAVLDIDPQRSLSRWLALRTARDDGRCPAITGSDVAGWRLQAELDRLKRNCDVLFVDSPPHVDHDARRAIRAADLLLIPVQPSLPDLWAAEGTLALAREEKRRACLILNRLPAGARAAATAQALLQKSGLQALPTTLGNRTGFAQAFATGLGVTEAYPRSTAANEIRALADQIRSA